MGGKLRSLNLHFIEKANYIIRGFGVIQTGSPDITVTCFDETTHKPSFRMSEVIVTEGMVGSSIIQPGFKS